MADLENLAPAVFEDALSQFSRKFDIFGAAGFLATKTRGTVDSFDKALELFPQLKEMVMTGVGNEGRMAFRLLNSDGHTVLMLAAMEKCHAPAHLHIGLAAGFGKITMTLAGDLVENLGRGRFFHSQGNNAVNVAFVCENESCHQPFTHTFWLGIYLQFGGMKLFTKLNKDELLKVLRSGLSEHDGWQPAKWQDLSEEESRAYTAKLLNIVV